VKILLPLLFIFFNIHAQEKKYAVNTVAFYNVENLFDTFDDPNNTWDEARTPDGEDRWTEKKISN